MRAAGTSPERAPGPEIAPGLVIAAPASGSGKTTITLGLLRAFRDAGLAVGSAKTGPDYIDPRFHAAASGRPCVNLDGWAMRAGLLDQLAARAAARLDLLIVEGVMGLFDGAARPGAAGNGSTADLAERMGWPVILVIDARAQAQSVAALARGFRDHRAALSLAGVILNRVAGVRHADLMKTALDDAGITVFGAVPRTRGMAVPSRHLGLVQAGEHADLERFIKETADTVAGVLDLPAIRRAAAVQRADAGRLSHAAPRCPPLAPLGQRIAVADDAGFGFSYAHVLDGWRAAGAEILSFSPLADAAPAVGADAVYLPGGYPELHAGRLAANATFLAGLRQAAADGKPVFGECGGYMVLGDVLVDGDGRAHEMAGLLGLESSFAAPALSLGYRLVRTLAPTPFGPTGTALRGHEFHYARVRRETGGDPIFEAEDAKGEGTGTHGLRQGSVFGSFLHLIDGEN